MNNDTHQQHPLGVYLKVWCLLFVLSIFSYLVDFFQLQGYVRWSLVLVFMTLKAGLIMIIFMHLGGERLALKYLVIVPPTVILVLIALMAIEADYTYMSRADFFSESDKVYSSSHSEH